MRSLLSPVSTSFSFIFDKVPVRRRMFSKHVHGVPLRWEIMSNVPARSFVRLLQNQKLNSSRSCSSQQCGYLYIYTYIRNFSLCILQWNQPACAPHFDQRTCARCAENGSKTKTKQNKNTRALHRQSQTRKLFTVTRAMALTKSEKAKTRGNTARETIHLGTSQTATDRQGRTAIKGTAGRRG